MKVFFTFLLMVSYLTIFSQNTKDTIIVPTFNYSQTYGHPWDGVIRDTMINFPDETGETYRRILMAYNIRCKDGNISVPGNTNIGCGEWDYSCNTYITDSARVDSVINFTNSHYISNLQGETFYYVENPLYDFYQYNEKEVVLNNIDNEVLATVGSGDEEFTEVIATNEYAGKSQFLFTKQELSDAGVLPGEIDAFLLENLGPQTSAGFLKIKIKATNKTVLNPNNPDLPGAFDGFTEVFFNDYTFVTGQNRIQFYQPFFWNGTSNILVEFSFTNKQPQQPLKLKSSNTGQIYGIYSTNDNSLKALNGYVNVDANAFNTISDEITISFWSYGDKDILPAQNSLFWGTDSVNRRQANVHLPWSNSKVYFDCGNDGSGFDRVINPAPASIYKGTWTHWAFTKNTATGEMKIYVNGTLWKNGTGKTKPIDIVNFFIGGNSKTLFYYGKIDEFRVWNKELDQTTIHDWMNRNIDENHPYYANLIADYHFDEGSGTIVNDASSFGTSSEIHDFMYWVHNRGFKLFNGFKPVQKRPVTTFAQGDYNITVNNKTVIDTIIKTPTIVKEYQIIHRYGSFLDDSIAEISVNEFWQADNEYIYDNEGNILDSIIITPTDSITITELTYYKRYPSKIELMSFVTPYGIYLDLGENGKTWFFDVTDYAPILKGRKRMTIERGGQWQEDMDIKFYFIKGTPPRDVLDMRQIWRVQYKSFNSIHNERSYETRNVMMPANGSAFKIRAVITGHGQEGEFIRRHHTLNINGGETEFDWYVWNECSTIPIYPQGGTWIYDRAGWCPGNPTVINDFDITNLVTPGQTASVDYDIPTATGNSNYIVNIQLMTYGPPNFENDAAIVKILKPNAADASQGRFNPACSYPEVVIQNTGAGTLTSLNLIYNAEGEIVQTYQWNGSLEFMEKDTVVLPVDELSFWHDNQGVFTVYISGDQNIENNMLSVPFQNVDVYPEGEPLIIKLWTNERAYQTSYTLVKEDGTVILDKDNFVNNTLYEEQVNLEPGCYKLEIQDSGDDGLEFWANPGQGVGSFSLKNSDGETLYNFDPDFGGFAIYEFGIGNITRLDEVKNPFTINVFPNPANDYLKINLKGKQSAGFDIYLTNLMMIPLIHKQVVAPGGEFSEFLDIKKIPSGVYLLMVKYNDYKKVVKIVKE